MNKILIIEDDQIVANVYRNKLAVEGYNVEIAHDGEEGYAKIHTFLPDLVILDLIIPKLAGVDLMRKLRTEPAFEKLPIIVFSNTYLSNVVKDAWKAGATKCLSKANCTPKQVIDVVRSVLTAGHVAEPMTGAPAPAAASAAAPASPDPASKAKPVISKVEETLDASNEFLGNALKVLADLRNSLQALFKNPDDATRTKLLDDMYLKVHSLTGASVVGLSLISQMTDAFEALLKELRDKPQGINPSTLRTIASAADFLELLVKKGRAAETRSPAPKILVVDDELLSRRAVTHALDRAKLPSSDVEDPLTALKLLSDNSYDLIFLDADMPGMNGFELCAKLRTLPYHKKTPVVFVTALNDFEARANSTMAGANDFIGKPFPFIELAVKALIYVLRGRLESKR